VYEVGFFRGIFGGDSPAGAPVRAGNQRQFSAGRRASTSSSAPSASRGQVVLDLGATSPANLHFITGLGHRAYNEDLLLAASDPELLIPGRW